MLGGPALMWAPSVFQAGVITRTLRLVMLASCSRLVFDLLRWFIPSFEQSVMIDSIMVKGPSIGLEII